MPSLNADFTDDELEMLEGMRVQWGLSSLEETAQFLAKRFIRQSMKVMTGRGRAMNLVSLEDLERTTE